MTPPTDKLEAQTREEIDEKLKLAGWVVQDKKRINLIESLGVAVREMDTDSGPADYMLFVDGKACGIIEAKREGEGLGHVAEQSARYGTSNVQFIERWLPNDQPLPFLYEATNHEIRFRDERDPAPRSRNVFHFHRPETFKAWLEEGGTLRQRFHDLPALDVSNLRDCQIEAITGIEKSLKQGKPRALLQMATGSGKTYTAVTEVYRLAKFSSKPNAFCFWSIVPISPPTRKTNSNNSSSRTMAANSRSITTSIHSAAPAFPTPPKSPSQLSSVCTANSPTPS